MGQFADKKNILCRPRLHNDKHIVSKYTSIETYLFSLTYLQYLTDIIFCFYIKIVMFI